MNYCTRYIQYRRSQKLSICDVVYIVIIIIMYDELFYPYAAYYLYPSILQIMVADRDESQL